MFAASQSKHKTSISKAELYMISFFIGIIETR